MRWSGTPTSSRMSQFAVTYTVKSFLVVDEAEVDVFKITPLPAKYTHVNTHMHIHRA